jgi:hypothetical protein
VLDAPRDVAKLEGMCPRCRQNAPLVYRGMAAYCSACGAPRVPLTTTSVTLAGKPSQVGGAVARVFGWLVLVGGLSLALILGSFFQWVLAGGFVGYAIGGPLALVATVLGWMLLRSGKSLQAHGTGQEKGARTQALFALAQNRGGMITAMDAAQALAIPAAEADALLTELAKTVPDHVSLEVDDGGGIYFRFPGVLGAWQGHGVRVDASVAPSRVATEPLPAEVEVLEADVIPPARQPRPSQR